MAIPHLESFANKPQKALYILEKLQKNDFVATEKMDGFNCSIQVKDGKLSLNTKSKTFVREEDFTEEIVAFAELKRYFSELSKIVFPHDFIVCGEAIPNYDFNTIKYNKDKIGNGVFVIVNAEGYDEEIARSLSVVSIKFMDVQVVPIQRTGLEKEIGVIESELSMHGEVLSKPARKEKDKKEKYQAQAAIQQALINAKYKMLNSISLHYKPLLGDDTEGFVANFDDGTIIKLVDKEKFTAKNAENWKFISSFSRIERDILSFCGKEKFDEKVLLLFKEFDELEQELKKTKLEGTVLEQTLLTKNNVKRMIKNYVEYTKIKPGGALKSVNSIVDREQIDPTIQSVVKELGIYFYTKVGNNQKEFVGDIDIAVSADELETKFGSGEEFWINLEERLKQTGREYKIIKGLRQFHLAVEVPVGYEPGTLKKIENGTIQVDFLVGDLSWMNVILSSNKDSLVKAAVRNTFIKALCEANNNINETGSMEYSLNFRDGLWVKIFDLKQPEGRQKNVQKELVHKFLLTNNPIIGLQKFLFPYNKPDKVIQDYSFEFWFDLFQQRYPKENQEKALLIFKELCAKNHLEFPEKAQRAIDNKRLIALYPGAFKPFHRGHFEVVKRLAKEADEVVILASIADREEMSGFDSYCWIEDWCISFFPTNVRVEYTDKPILYAIKLAHENNNVGNSTLFFVDEIEFSQRMSMPSVEYRTLERIDRLSGTEFRKAIREQNKEIVRNYVIKPNFYFDTQFEYLVSNPNREKHQKKYSLLVANIKAAGNHGKRR